MHAALAAALAIVAVVPHASAQAEPRRRSGFDDMTPATQAMQRDDLSNPGMLWVSEGEALWQRKPRSGDRACASCHGDDAASMRGVAVRYPAFDDGLARPVTLSQRIGLCRQRHQGLEPLAPESAESLALEAFVAHKSRGMAIDPPRDARLEPWRERGRAFYGQRIGQLDLACAHCHDRHAGARLAGSVIPQGHPTAYPIYRLEWQAMGSLERRLRGCMTAVRAEPPPYGAVELVELELFLAKRAAGMPLETPGVRP